MATGAPTGPRFGLQARFTVTLDGLDMGGWSKCTGLAVEFTTHPWEPMGHNNYLPVLPDRIKYGKITLERAINATDTPTVIKWLADKANGKADGTGSIAVLGPDAKPVMAWHLRGVYPASWKGPSLDANGKAIATETLELHHEGFLPGL